MLPDSIIISDKEFDLHLPGEIRSVGSRHWATASIARRAAKFLVSKPGARVLDIGSGTGKFCIIAAASQPSGIFTGVEQRKNLCLLADKIARQYKLSNTNFIHANVIEIDFAEYDAFFFYNSFYENIEGTHAIDYSVDLNPALYHTYTALLTNKLLNMPIGARLVTYWGNWIPDGYELLYSNANDSLKFWERRS